MKNLSLNKGRPSCLCIFIFAILLSNQIHASELTFRRYAQQPQQQIMGSVRDAVGPLSNVTIVVKGTNISSVTDDNGKFTITANSTDVLIFSFLGFRSQEVAVGSQTSINVTLAEDSTQLEEVTINAGYYTVKDKERTGSIARITSKDIETQPVTNVLATMQGRMAGVDIIQNTGVPGGGFNIRIRGTNSLRPTGNNPLYVIDGVPYSAEPIGYGSASILLPGPVSPLNSINPAEIESIEVLKDADATAIYGSRGANGVVLVTTKRGKSGKTTYSIGYSRGFGRVTRMMDMLNTQQYLEMREEAFQNDDIEPGPMDYDVNGVWQRDRYTDWQKEFLGGTADITNVTASATGGSENTRYLLSSNYYKETTVFPGDYAYDRINTRFQMSHESTDKRFRANVTAGYTAQRNGQPATDPTLMITMLPANAPALRDEQGNINWENSTWTNPLGDLKARYSSKTYDVIANAMLSYRLFNGFDAKVSLGFTDTRINEARTQPSDMYDPAYLTGPEFSIIDANATTRQSYIIEPQLTYSKQWDKAGFEALVGTTFQQQGGDRLAQRGTGFSSNELIYDLASASRVAVLSHINSVYRYQAVFARANLNWDKKYIINLTGRRDGSSRFGPGHQFANFGAVGAAWLISNEGFWKSNVVSFAKLRGSYGITGNDQIGDYQFLDAYGSSANNYNGIVGLQPTRLYNPDFAWEVNHKLELALELSFLRDRLFLTAGWFRNQSSNQLVGTPLPATTGFPTLQANLDATIENRGFEITLRSQNFQSENFSWVTSINFSTIENKLTAFPNLEGSTYRSSYIIGQPVNIIKLYQYEGIDPDTGLYQFKDFNNDGVITGEDDMEAVGNLNPSFFGGIANQLTCKGFALDFHFQFVQQDNYNETATTGIPGMAYNQPASVMDRWQQPGDNARFQRFTTGVDSEAVTAASQFGASTGAISDASYIRLKNIALSYTLPKEWLGGVGCRINVEAQNLLTITSYKGRDPEFGATNFLPPLKIITTGIQLNF